MRELCKQTHKSPPQNKTNARSTVEALLLTLTGEELLTRAQIAEMTGLSIDVVSKTIANMRSSRSIFSDRPGSAAAGLRLTTQGRARAIGTDRMAVGATPSQNRWSSGGAPVEASQPAATKTVLRPHQTLKAIGWGAPPRAESASNALIPSRRGDKLVAYTPPVSMAVGKREPIPMIIGGGRCK